MAEFFAMAGGRNRVNMFQGAGLAPHAALPADIQPAGAPVGLAVAAAAPVVPVGVAGIAAGPVAAPVLYQPGPVLPAQAPPPAVVQRVAASPRVVSRAGRCACCR